MSENNTNKTEQDTTQLNSPDRTVGNQQGTTQTGAQNAGGTRNKEDDDYTEDLLQSGDRHSSNRKEE